MLGSPSQELILCRSVAEDVEMDLRFMAQPRGRPQQDVKILLPPNVPSIQNSECPRTYEAAAELVPIPRHGGEFRRIDRDRHDPDLVRTPCAPRDPAPHPIA
jgi:hypothetical protein